MKTEIHCLQERVARLEKRNKLLSLAGMAMMALVFLGAAEGPEKSRASAFQLVDGEGRVRAELALREDGPGLFILDENQIDRVSIFHREDGSGLFIADSQGVTRVGAVQFAHGGGGFALHGPESKGAAVLYLKGEGSLRFFDGDGKVTNQVLAKPKE